MARGLNLFALKRMAGLHVCTNSIEMYFSFWLKNCICFSVRSEKNHIVKHYSICIFIQLRKLGRLVQGRELT